MTARKKPQPAFVPIESAQVVKEKAVISQENQERFHTWFQALSGPQRKAVTEMLDMLIAVPFITEGYRRFFSFWRVYRKNYDQQVGL